MFKRSYCEIITPFVIFFLVDKIMKLFGGVIIRPWAIRTGKSETVAIHIQLTLEIIVLLILAKVLYHIA